MYRMVDILKQQINIFLNDKVSNESFLDELLIQLKPYIYTFDRAKDEIKVVCESNPQQITDKNNFLVGYSNGVFVIKRKNGKNKLFIELNRSKFTLPLIVIFILMGFLGFWICYADYGITWGLIFYLLLPFLWIPVLKLQSHNTEAGIRALVRNIELRLED